MHNDQYYDNEDFLAKNTTIINLNIPITKSSHMHKIKQASRTK